MLTESTSTEILSAVQQELARLVRPAAVPELMKPAEASAYIGIQRTTLGKWRCLHLGPPFVKVGGRVAYRRRDLDAWLESRVRNRAAVQVGARTRRMRTN